MQDVTHLLEQGQNWLQQNQPLQALLYFNQAALGAPESIETLMLCTECLQRLQRPAEAVIYSQRALQQIEMSSTTSLQTKVLTLHAQALYQLGQYHQALHFFETVINAEPHNYTAIGQRALCLTQVNRYEEAHAAYQQALKLSQYQDPWIYYNYSLCLLAMGQLTSGFTAYEYRWRTALAAKNRAWVFPESLSMDRLQGKSILIHSEQGLGDSIQFFRYIPLLVSLGARVFFEIQPALLPVFAAWQHSMTLIALGAPLPVCDYHCPLLSLAHLFQTDLQTIPSSIPYVFPDLSTLAACQIKLGVAKRPRIGIAWRGSSINPMNKKRSIDLSTLLTINQPHLDFICLQKEVNTEEKKQLDHHQIAYHSLELHTLIGTIALIACVDLVITIDTSIAHLAAAMGKTVWILLPFSADWRWLLQRSDSPWYPHVCLFRQEALGDWCSPLAHISHQLKHLFSPSPFNADACTRAAQLAYQQKQWAAAEQQYRQIMIHHPEWHRVAHSIALVALQQNKLTDALQFMQQALHSAPSHVLYRRNLGELLRRLRQLDAAIGLHQMTIQIEPSSAENHFLLALTYHDNQQFELAVQHYRQAVSLDPDYGLAWNNLGASLECMGNSQHALEAYMEAIRLNPNHAEAQNNVGALYSEAGNITKAQKHFAAAIAANPDFIEAHYNLSQLKTYTPQDPHLHFLETFSEKIFLCSDQTKIHYYFALGKALDDTQQYARAFQAYAKGNRLYAMLKPWHKRPLQTLIASFPKIFTQKWLIPPALSSETRCPIFIVGMPRAGTTLIEQILSSHASIHGAGELSVLDDLIQVACQAAGQTFLEWAAQLTEKAWLALGQTYLDKVWALAPDKRYIIDKMPSNCFYLGMIYRMFPTAKIIHAIRDPMDSCFSCFTHLFKYHLPFAYDLQDLADYYTLYAQAMAHWHSVLPAGFIFDLPYERMVAQHEILSKQLVDYIGLPWDPNCLQFYKNDRAVKTASLTQVRQPIYHSSVRRWYHFATELQPLLDMLAPYRTQQGISA